MRKVSFLITITVALTLVAGCGASESVVPAAAASVSTSVPVTPTATPAPAPTSISPCINPTKDGWKVIAGNSIDILFNIEGDLFLWAIELDSLKSPSSATVRLALMDPNNTGWGWPISEEVISFGKTLANNGDKGSISVINPDRGVAVISIMKCQGGIYSQYRIRRPEEVDG